MLMTYIKHYDFISSISTALKILCALPTRPSSSSSTLVTTDLTVTIVLCFPECHTVGIIQYISFTDKVLSLNNMHLRFLHVFPFFLHWIIFYCLDLLWFINPTIMFFHNMFYIYELQIKFKYIFLQLIFCILLIKWLQI